MMALQLESTASNGAVPWMRTWPGVMNGLPFHEKKDFSGYGMSFIQSFQQWWMLCHSNSVGSVNQVVCRLVLQVGWPWGPVRVLFVDRVAWWLLPKRGHPWALFQTLIVNWVAYRCPHQGCWSWVPVQSGLRPTRGFGQAAMETNTGTHLKPSTPTRQGDYLCTFCSECFASERSKSQYKRNRYPILMSKRLGEIATGEEVRAITTKLLVAYHHQGNLQTRWMDSRNRETQAGVCLIYASRGWNLPLTAHATQASTIYRLLWPKTMLPHYPLITGFTVASWCIFWVISVYIRLAYNGNG